MKTIAFQFTIGQKVMVKEIQRPGVVEILQFDSLGIQVKVAYWDNSDRKSAWLYEWELEER